MVLYETHKNNNLILSKLVQKAEHQLAERDRFTFNQIQNDYEEKHDHLAKLIREAHEAKHGLKCKCPQTIESKVRHAKSKIRREKLLKVHLSNPPRSNPKRDPREVLATPLALGWQTAYCRQGS